MLALPLSHTMALEAFDFRASFVMWRRTVAQANSRSRENRVVRIQRIREEARASILGTS